MSHVSEPYMRLIEGMNTQVRVQLHNDVCEMCPECGDKSPDFA